jgi:phosphatidylserine/phosphatidylglycerophosphate/cardiolipin synthase-like enzyme
VGFANGPVQVYFTRPGRALLGRGPAGGLDATLAADIAHAQESIDLAFFDFDLPSVAAASIEARARGLSVRAVVDAENLGKPGVARLTGEMQTAGIPITFDRRAAFMHDKFVVIDRKGVWTGSWNATANDTFRNDNNMLRLADDRVADNYTRKFDLLFAGHGGPGHPAALPHPLVGVADYRIATAFAPDGDVTGQIVSTLRRARHSIEFLSYTFTSEPIADALVATRKRGVRVRGVVEQRNVRVAGSAVPKLKRVGVDVREDGNCGLMHDKVVVVDGRTVITGSFNWTRQAQAANDENVVLVDNGWLAQRYAGEFERIYAQAVHPMRCGN